MGWSYLQGQKEVKSGCERPFVSGFESNLSVSPSSSVQVSVCVKRGIKQLVTWGRSVGGGVGGDDLWFRLCGQSINQFSQQQKQLLGGGRN